MADGKEAPYADGSFRLMDTLEIRALPALERVQFGSFNFLQAKNVVFEALPELTSFSIANNTMTKVTEMTLNCIPKLETIESIGSALSHLETLRYRNITDPLYQEWCLSSRTECQELCPFCFT